MKPNLLYGATLVAISVAVSTLMPTLLGRSNSTAFVSQQDRTEGTIYTEIREITLRSAQEHWPQTWAPAGIRRPRLAIELLEPPAHDKPTTPLSDKDPCRGNPQGFVQGQYLRLTLLAVNMEHRPIHLRPRALLKLMASEPTNSVQVLLKPVETWRHSLHTDTDARQLLTVPNQGAEGWSFVSDELCTLDPITQAHIAAAKTAEMDMQVELLSFTQGRISSASQRLAIAVGHEGKQPQALDTAKLLNASKSAQQHP